MNVIDVWKFEFFDDFWDGIIDASKWRAYDLNGGAGTATEADGVMKLTVTVNGTVPPVLPSVPTFVDGILEAKGNFISATATPHIILKFRYVDNTSNIEFTIRGGANDDIYFYDGGYLGKTAYENLDVHANEWHYIRIQFSGTTVEAYVKNLVTGLEGTTSATVTTTASNPIGLSVWMASTEVHYDHFMAKCCM